MNPATAKRNEKENLAGVEDVEWESVVCALCGEAANRFVLEASHLLYGRPGSSRIVQCRHCGHYYQNPQPTRDTIALCYPTSYGPHLNHEASTASENNAANHTPWHLSRVPRAVPGLRRLYHWLGDRYSELPLPADRPGRALEIGCGNGRYLEAMQARGWKIEGIEPALEPGARCRARGLRVRTGIFDEFEFETNSYDAVIAWMVVEHLHDPMSVLREIHRILRPTGVLLFSVPNFACWETWVFRSYHFTANEPTHLQHFTSRSAKQLLTDSGFELARLHYQENLYNVVGSIGLWLSHRFPKVQMGRRLLEFCESPNMWGRLALAPFAKLAAGLHQTGRMTIVARPVSLPDRNAAHHVSEENSN